MLRSLLFVAMFVVGAAAQGPMSRFTVNAPQTNAPTGLGLGLAGIPQPQANTLPAYTMPGGASPVLPQNYMQPVAAPLTAPVLSPQQANAVVPMSDLQAALNQRVASLGITGAMQPSQQLQQQQQLAFAQQPFATGIQQPFAGIQQQQQPFATGIQQQVPFQGVGVQQQPFGIGVQQQQPFLQQQPILQQQQIPFTGVQQTQIPFAGVQQQVPFGFGGVQQFQQQQPIVQQVPLSMGAGMIQQQPFGMGAVQQQQPFGMGVGMQQPFAQQQPIGMPIM